MDLMFVFGAVLVAAFVALVVMVAVSTRRNTRIHEPTRRAAPTSSEPERDPWEEALLANTPDALTYPGAPPAAPGPGPTVLDREALERRNRDFDPTAWDDRPDGYEGTDFGLVGDADR